MVAKKRLLTYAGLKALEDELENLKVVKRKEVAGKIKEAREQGDLSENAEYDAAKVFDITFDEEMEFKIVGSTEANSLEGKISNESPVGQALIGKSVGDVVEVETQAGVMEYKVLDISRSQ